MHTQTDIELPPRQGGSTVVAQEEEVTATTRALNAPPCHPDGFWIPRDKGSETSPAVCSVCGRYASSITAAPSLSDATTFLQMIERAARDPAVDLDKMERLILMRDRMLAQEAKMAFNEALSHVQSKLPVIDRKGKIVIKDKNNEERVRQSTPYALFEDINEAVKPIIAEHGFSVSFRTGSHEDGRIKVTAILKHRGGHEEETTIILPHDSTGSKNAVQAIGSSTSYGKRMTMCALLNITSRGEDDDGKASGTAPDTISEDEISALSALIAQTKTDTNKFLRFFKISAFSDLPKKRLAEAQNMLNKKNGK